MDNIAWAYIAGLFDGEGSVLITRDKHNYYTLQVQLVLTHKEAIDKLAAMTGGFVCRPTRPSDPNRLPAWRWGLKSRKAAAFLEQVLPYLIVKRRQAELGLAFQSRCAVGKHASRGGFRPLPQEEWDAREHLYWQIRVLNNHRNLAKVPEHLSL